MDDLCTLIDRIRRNVFAEAEQRFADETFQYLRCSLHNSRMKDADSTACMIGGDGDSVEIYLKFAQNRVENATYISDGDCSSCLSGSYTAELAIGRTPIELMSISAADVMRRAGRTGRGFEKYVLVAVGALHKATENYRLQQMGISVREGKSTDIPRILAVGKGLSHMQYDN